VKESRKGFGRGFWLGISVATIAFLLVTIFPSRNGHYPSLLGDVGSYMCLPGFSISKLIFQTVAPNWDYSEAILFVSLFLIYGLFGGLIGIGIGQTKGRKRKTKRE
jgi:hypothetical protein